MVSWGEFTDEAPELARFGRERLANRVGYLGTIRADGSPRVHPVTPIISSNRLFLFMEPASPKGKDIERDGCYSLHCGVEDDSGGEGEFYVRGRARRSDDPAARQEAISAAGYTPKDHYILFVLDVDYAFMNIYDEDGQPTVRRWQHQTDH
jgi:hypothetical protein